MMGSVARDALQVCLLLHVTVFEEMVLLLVLGPSFRMSPLVVLKKRRGQRVELEVARDQRWKQGTYLGAAITRVGNHLLTSIFLAFNPSEMCRLALVASWIDFDFAAAQGGTGRLLAW